MANYYRSHEPENGTHGIERHERALRRYLKRFASPSYPVDDLVQDTYVAALTTIRNRGPPERMRPWLYRVAERTAYRQLYKKRPRYRETDDPNLLLDEHQPEPVDSTIHNEELVRLGDALDHLCGADRALLAGRYFSRQSLADLAGELGAGTDAVKVRLYRAGRKLRKGMEG